MNNDYIDEIFQITTLSLSSFPIHFHPATGLWPLPFAKSRSIGSRNPTGCFPKRALFSDPFKDPGIPLIHYIATVIVLKRSLESPKTNPLAKRLPTKRPVPRCWRWSKVQVPGKQLFANPFSSTGRLRMAEKNHHRKGSYQQHSNKLKHGNDVLKVWVTISLWKESLGTRWCSVSFETNPPSHSMMIHSKKYKSLPRCWKRRKTSSSSFWCPETSVKLITSQVFPKNTSLVGKSWRKRMFKKQQKIETRVETN